MVAGMILIPWVQTSNEYRRIVKEFHIIPKRLKHKTHIRHHTMMRWRGLGKGQPRISPGLGIRVLPGQGMVTTSKRTNRLGVPVGRVYSKVPPEGTGCGLTGVQFARSLEPRT